MYNRLRILLSPLFVFCLVLLIVNDFLLKATFHNSLTGKLSDFCGLFIFPILWSAIFPRRKLWVFIFSGILFIYWKSDYASGLIELISPIFKIQRTVDPTDLIALPVLMVAWFHTKSSSAPVFANPLVTRLSTLVIGVVTIFSFCATSQQRYVQSFDHPQYVLLRSDANPDSLSSYDEFEFYKMDSLVVVKVNHLFIPRPIRDDDYNKNRWIKTLDKDVMEMLTDSASLIPSDKITTLTLNTAQGKDSLRFTGGRLDGRFTRTKNNKIIIEGFYTMGIEDSIWSFRDTSSTEVIVQTFVNGERTSVKQFDKDKLRSTTHINTRADTIRNTYIQIGVLILLMAGIIVLLVKNYRSTTPEQLKLKLGWKWVLCFISPIIVWLFYMGIRILLMDFNQDIFETIAAIIFIFMASCPLMVIVVFWIKLRKDVDILLYCLLLGLACSTWTICGTLIELSN